MKSIHDLREQVKGIIEFAGSKNLWIFFGEMGAGKTTVVKEVCRQLGVKEPVTSPTFSLVNEYIGSTEKPIYHFDFYRIKDESEAMDIGVDEYFDSGNLCLIEWPEKIPSLLHEPFLAVHISAEASGERKIILHHHG